MRMMKRAGLIAVAMAAMLAVGAAHPDCRVAAQGNCSNDCKAAYGSCYKASQNRAACEAQLQRCLQGCMGR
jgi:hypothetical protein